MCDARYLTNPAGTQPMFPLVALDKIKLRLRLTFGNGILCRRLSWCKVFPTRVAPQPAMRHATPAGSLTEMNASAISAHTGSARLPSGGPSRRLKAAR